jgi:hypothetical protein
VWELREIKKNSVRVAIASLFFFSESNSIPPEYEARVLATHPICLVIIYINCLTADVVF